MGKRLKDIVGLKYGRLTIMGDAPKRRSKGGHSQRFVFVKCECGNEMEVQLNAVTGGNTKSCGCGKLNGSKLSNVIYDGMVFGRLMVIREVEGFRRPSGIVSRAMECECECGTIKVIRLGDVKSGRTTSCGCLAREVASEYNSKKLTIGQERGNLVLLRELERTIKYNERGGVISTIRNVEAACKKCGDVVEISVFRFSHESQPDDCGCSIGEKISKALRGDIDFGGKYGRLTILKEVDPVNFIIDPNNNKYFRRRVQCECECGVIKDVDLVSVMNGSTRSCGCLVVDTMKELFTTHGLTTTIEGRGMYHRWHGILSRCYDANNPSFIYYGARGIKMCERWREDVMAFIDDLGYPPSGEHSLDRIDVDGDYELSNCRWATIDVQSNNKRSNKWYKNKQPNPTL